MTTSMPKPGERVADDRADGGNAEPGRAELGLVQLVFGVAESVSRRLGPAGLDLFRVQSGASHVQLAVLCRPLLKDDPWD